MRISTVLNDSKFEADFISYLHMHGNKLWNLKEQSKNKKTPYKLWKDVKVLQEIGWRSLPGTEIWQSSKILETVLLHGFLQPTSGTSQN